MPQNKDQFPKQLQIGSDKAKSHAISNATVFTLSKKINLTPD